MRKRTAIKLVSLVITVSLLGLVVMFVREGLDHETPALRLRRAQLQWESGETGEAVQTLYEAFRMALEEGLRYSLARPFIDEMGTLREKGRINEAYDRCMKAVAILDTWDEEGMVSYDCFSLWIYLNCTLVEDQMVCSPMVSSP